MKRSRTTRADGLAGALALYLGLFLSVLAAFAASLYWLMQPSVRGNPGLAAYKPPPATVLASAPARPRAQSIAPPADMAAAKPEPAALATVNTDNVRPADVKPAEPPAPVAEVKKKKRKVAKRRRSRDPMSDYAAQYNNGYRSWGGDRNERPSQFGRWF